MLLAIMRDVGLRVIHLDTGPFAGTLTFQFRFNADKFSGSMQDAKLFEVGIDEGAKVVEMEFRETSFGSTSPFWPFSSQWKVEWLLNGSSEFFDTVKSPTQTSRHGDDGEATFGSEHKG